jgi:hypothetical protein
MNIQLLLVFKDNQIMLVPFMVTKEEVFTMCSLQVLPVQLCLFNGWGWRVPVILKRDVEVF